MTAAELRRAAAAVLEANWREGTRADGVPFAYTCPSVPRYRHMWHWDSCFHAIANRHLRPDRAKAELRTVLRSGRGDGFLPHTVFWDRAPGWRRAPLYATSRTAGDRWTESIGPPVLALAWELVARDDPAFAAEGVAPLSAHLDWLERARDVDGDGLLTILLPDESGMDDSPKYDPAYGALVHWRPGYARLVQRCRRAGWDAHRYCARHDEHVEDVLVNVLYALSLHALARLDGQPRSSHRAARVEAALMERCWDQRAGLFRSLAGRGERKLEVSTWDALAPLALPGVPREVKHRMVEEHLLHPSRYRAACGIPSVAMDEPSFRPGFDRWRAWRGPSWVNAAWLLVPPLRELGLGGEADRIVGSLADAVARSGFREYYDPRSGDGLAAKRFGWSTLLVDLLADQGAEGGTTGLSISPRRSTRSCH